MSALSLLQQVTNQPEPSLTLNDAVTLFVRTLTNLLRYFVGRLPYLLVGLFVFLIFWIVSRLLKSFIVRVAVRTKRVDPTAASLIARLIGLTINIIGFLSACVVIFPSFRPGDIIAGLGIVSVAIGLAFKDILQNFFAGMLIMWRHPFRIGDQMQVRGFEGTVEEINMRSTRLRTYTGERVVLPNGYIYTSALLIRTAARKRRVDMPLSIAYPSAIDDARRVIHRVLKDTNGVANEPAPWVYVSELSNTAINLIVYFWTESRQDNVLKVSDQVATDIKIALEQIGIGIHIPYPHTVSFGSNPPATPPETDPPGPRQK